MKTIQTLVLTLIIGSMLLFINCTNTPDYSLKCFQSDNDSWYYEIYYKDQLLIKQENIPSVKGAKKFKFKEDASKVGSLVIKKLEEGNAPTISFSELKKLNIHLGEKN